MLTGRENGRKVHGYIGWTGRCFMEITAAQAEAEKTIASFAVSTGFDRSDQDAAGVRLGLDQEDRGIFGVKKPEKSYIMQNFLCERQNGQRSDQSRRL